MIITTNTIESGDDYPQVDFECGHNNISRNNKTNTIYCDNYVPGNLPRGKGTIININTVGERDDYTQLAYAIVTGRHNNISRINNNGENKIT
jgi:hypothetical protein